LSPVHGQKADSPCPVKRRGRVSWVRFKHSRERGRENSWRESPNFGSTSIWVITCCAFGPGSLIKADLCTAPPSNWSSRARSPRTRLSRTLAS
jgi:hypothetical protein